MRPDHPPDDHPSAADREAIFRLREERDTAIQSAQAAVRDTSRLTRLFTILSEPAPLEIMFDRVLSTLSEMFEADICVLLDPAGTGSFSPLAAVGLPEEMINLSMSPAVSGYVSTAMTLGTPILKTDIGHDQAVDPQLRELGVETALWVPVIGSHGARGVLILGRCRPLPFAQADAYWLTAMAYRIGLALDQAQRSLQLEQIIRTGRQISCYLDESAVSSEAVNRLPAILGADAAALVLSGPDGSLRTVAQIGLDPVWASMWNRIAERLLATREITDGQPYSIADLQADDETFSGNLPDGFPGRALLAIPIRREQQTIGLLWALRLAPAPFSLDGIQIALLMAAQASAALENARLYRAVQEELAERLRAEQQLHESEERLKLALMGADLGMWDWNVVTGEVRFNERWAEMTGYSLEEIEPHVRSREKLIHPDDRPRVREMFRRHSERETLYYQAQYRCLTKSGDWIWVLDKGQVTHRDVQGFPLRFVGTCLDITEAKQIEAERVLIEQQKQRSHEELEKRVAERTQELASANQQLRYEINERKRAEEEAVKSKEFAEGANRAKNDFLANMSHELRTPLNHIIGFTELVAGKSFGDINATQEEFLNDVLNSSHHLLSLINQILDLSKIEAGKQDLNLSNVPFQDLLESSLTMVREKAFKKRIRISLHIDKGSPEFLSGDAGKLKQVMYNLLANSVKFTPNEGQIEIHCGVQKNEGGDPREVDGDRLLVGVKDSGIGIASADLERIFQPFEQAESSASRKYEGTGLGLPLARKLIELHGGRLWAESAGLGRGATFRFTVPIK